MRKWILTACVSCAVADAQVTAPVAPPATSQVAGTVAAPVTSSAATDVFDKAPPEVDQALRSRVAKFFQAHVDSKFRQAEEVIAEDSKDIFYNLEKSHYFSFDIVRINYSDNYSKATVVTGVEVEWRSPRIGVMRVKPPMTSLWKLENGQWYWYVVPQKDWDTPWGKMNPGPDVNQNKMMALFKGVDKQTVARQVTIDASQIRLKGYQESDGQFAIANSMPGEIQLRLNTPKIPGLDVKLDKTTLKSGEKGTISVHYLPQTTEPKAASEVSVNIDPTGQVFRVALTFDVQPELKKLLPKELQTK